MLLELIERIQQKRGVSFAVADQIVWQSSAELNMLLGLVNRICSERNVSAMSAMSAIHDCQEELEGSQAMCLEHAVGVLEEHGFEPTDLAPILDAPRRVTCPTN